MHPTSSTRHPARGTILEAAEARFREHGYRHTTVTDIAGDAGMSPANLYRYFENKERIGAACCERWMDARVDALRATARRKDLGAEARLRQLLLENLKVTQDLAKRQPHIHEMVETMTAGHPELVHQKIERMVALIAEVLAYGNERGEFVVADVVATARSVHCAQAVFEVPLFAHLYPEEYFEARLHDVVTLLVEGLKGRIDS